jgi:3-oxoadipate enol-lactonase
MPYLNTKTTQINYQLDGNPGNPALLFSNSLGTDLSMWDAQVRELSSEYFIVRYDTRGHGCSSRESKPFGLDTLGLDVLALLDHLLIDQVSFCGISMGGLIGQWLAIHAPERLVHLVIANTAAKIGTEEGWIDRANTIIDSGIDPIADTAASRWFSSQYVLTHAVDVARMISMLRQVSPKVYAYCCLALGGADFRQSIKAITTPTLIIAGEHDPVTTVMDAQFISQQIPDSKLLTLRASHLSNIESPDSFTKAIKAFFKEAS